MSSHIIPICSVRDCTVSRATSRSYFAACFLLRCLSSARCISVCVSVVTWVPLGDGVECSGNIDILWEFRRLDILCELSRLELAILVADDLLSSSCRSSLF